MSLVRLRGNPFATVTIAIEKRIRLRETPAFRSEELRKILQASLGISATDTPENAVRRLVPWLCAYTGARVGEITQLRKADVIEQDHIPALRLTPEAVHNAVRPAPMRVREFRTIARDFVGFGVAPDAERCLTDAPHSITLVFSDMLPPRRELSFVFTWPRSLTSEERKCRGHVDLTLCYTPPIDAAFDAECQRVQLEAHLYQLEEKDVGGEIKEHPQSRLNHSDSALPEHLAYTERYLLESGLKWTPIKRYERNMQRGIGTRGEWRLAVRTGREAKLAFKAHPHMLRHACGYALANKGHDTRAPQAYLGHRNIQHTVRSELSPTRFKDFWRN